MFYLWWGLVTMGIVISFALLVYLSITVFDWWEYRVTPKIPYKVRTAMILTWGGVMLIVVIAMFLLFSYEITKYILGG